MMLSLPQEARDKLRILAAEQNLRNPNRVTAAATIARELVLEGIERIEKMEAGLKPVSFEEEEQAEYSDAEK